MKSVSAKKIFSFSLLILTTFATQAKADQLQDMFSYQSSGEAIQKNFIRSNVEGLFEGQKISRKVSDQFSFEMLHLKTMHKELDLTHQNTLETSTNIDVNILGYLFSRIQLGDTREDIYSLNQNTALNDDSQKMYSYSNGWKGYLGSAKTEGYVGVVRCSDNTAKKFYPVFGMKIAQHFENNDEIQLSIAQEVQTGGSYTGIYGNQVFRKMMVMAKLPIMKKLSFLWDAGIGVSQTSYEEKGTKTGVATLSASLEYQLGTHVTGVFGYSNRKLIDLETGLGNAEGHMISASLAVANF